IGPFDRCGCAATAVLGLVQRGLRAYLRASLRLANVDARPDTDKQTSHAVERSARPAGSSANAIRATTFGVTPLPETHSRRFDHCSGGSFDFCTWRRALPFFRHA